MTEIAGRTGVVVGGGSGLGRGIALALAARGMAVAVGDIDGGAAASWDPLESTCRHASLSIL